MIETFARADGSRACTDASGRVFTFGSRFFDGHSVLLVADGREFAECRLCGRVEPVDGFVDTRLSDNPYTGFARMRVCGKCFSSTFH